jgi:hypothetical protein
MVLKLWDPNSENSPNQIPAHFKYCERLGQSFASFGIPAELHTTTRSEHKQKVSIISNFFKRMGPPIVDHMAGKMNCKKGGIQKSRRIKG